MVSVIIAAAGSGSRMNHEKKKQFIDLLGVPILVRTVRQFDYSAIDEIIIVTGEDDIKEVEQLTREYGLRVDKIVTGGQRRQDSIFNGLKVTKGDIVLIHDGARPFVTREIIKSNIESVSDCGIITAVACKDTIKLVHDRYVQETLDRSKLINVQTPQTFKRELILEAYDYVNEKKLSVTDDASVYEAYGKPVQYVEGSYENIKITTPEDLWMGELIIKKYN